MKIAPAKLAKSEVIDVYSRKAWLYDLWGVLAESKARRRAMSLAHIKSGEAVLEVAVGTGLTFREILKANPGGENIGVDLTPAMLQKAAQKASRAGARNYQLLAGDAYNLQFPARRFDVVMNNFMFDLLPETAFPIILAEFKRVLKPAGRIVLVNMTRSERLHEQIWESVYRLNARWLGGCRGVLLQTFLQDAGFADVKRETVSQLGFPAEVLSARVGPD